MRERGSEFILTKYDAREIRAIYDRGENITRWIQTREGANNNSSTAILYSYDAQAGSYVDALKDPAARALKEDIGRELGGWTLQSVEHYDYGDKMRVDDGEGPGCPCAGWYYVATRPWTTTCPRAEKKSGNSYSFELCGCSHWDRVK